MKHYTIFVKLVSNPKGRKLERKLYVFFNMFLWVHQACATMETNQNPTILPCQSYLTVLMNCCNFSFVKKHFNTNKTLFFFCLEGSFWYIAFVLKLLISIMLPLLKIFSKNEYKQKHPQTIKEISDFVDNLAVIPELQVLQLTFSAGIPTSLNNVNF